MKRVDDGNEPGAGVVDIFCGVGGLAHGFYLEDYEVIAGVDADPACEYAFASNNDASFIHCDVQDITTDEISRLFEGVDTSILVGCAPCQPFSAYSNDDGYDSSDSWGLLNKFAKLIKGVRPDYVTMENVRRLLTYKDGEVFDNFHEIVKGEGYKIWYDDVRCVDFGVPQTRKRLVMIGGLESKVELEDQDSVDGPSSVWDAIGDLPEISHGEVSSEDRLHRASELSELNQRRIRASKPGGTWEDWDEDLRADCHKKESGKKYLSVYGRMEKDGLSPTITTQAYGYGNGRFGHPEQNRAISLREAAILQTFPQNYRFVPPDDPVYMSQTGRHIGNAVPVNLARAIARAIRRKIE